MEKWRTCPFFPGILLRNEGKHGSVNITAGIRTVKFDADEGLKLNDESLKVRGFCDHSNWGAVGNAVPDRINFFRAQMLRSVGGNAWRMAHNPP